MNKNYKRQRKKESVGWRALVFEGMRHLKRKKYLKQWDRLMACVAFDKRKVFQLVSRHTSQSAKAESMRNLVPNAKRWVFQQLWCFNVEKMWEDWAPVCKANVQDEPQLLSLEKTRRLLLAFVVSGGGWWNQYLYFKEVSGQ